MGQTACVKVFKGGHRIFKGVEGSELQVCNQYVVTYPSALYYLIRLQCYRCQKVEMASLRMMEVRIASLVC